VNLANALYLASIRTQFTDIADFDIDVVSYSIVRDQGGVRNERLENLYPENPTVAEEHAHSGLRVAVKREGNTFFTMRHACATDCGADRDRTDDLRLAKPALSQLSYSPGIECLQPFWCSAFWSR
jgi:hypothetical protein